MKPREILTASHRAALEAVEPRAAVLRHCQREGDQLIIDGTAIDLARIDRIVVVGGGKASAPMAAAVEELLADRIDAGLVVVKDGHTCQTSHCRLVEASHPVPDQRGADGAAAILDMVGPLGERDLVINCLSGGASALLPAPRAPMSLADKQAMSKALLASGADIHALNCLRRHVSRIKGGHLARAVAPARLVNLIISDVIGDDLNTIGSGPGVPDPSSLEDARQYYDQHLARRDDVPATVATVLADARSETPKPGDPCFEHCRNCLIATNEQAQAAMASRAEAEGIAIERWGDYLEGDANQAAEQLVARAIARQTELSAPLLILAGGECTVILNDEPGRGGRCQTLALAAAKLLQGHPGITVLAAGTDGNDGPTDACGAFADCETWSQARSAGFDPDEQLRRNDEYPLLKAIDLLLMTGPTNTNVMDLYALLVMPVH